MYVDLNIVKEKVKQRQNRIETYAVSNKVEKVVAAIYVDQNSPITTNRMMLAEVGYPVKQVHLDNYRDVIYALKDINVIVISDGLSEETIVSKLNDVIDEPVNECWGGPDMQEYIDLNG